jgi:uncharacterized protein (TIGR02246 family)
LSFVEQLSAIVSFHGVNAMHRASISLGVVVALAVAVAFGQQPLPARKAAPPNEAPARSAIQNAPPARAPVANQAPAAQPTQGQPIDRVRAPATQPTERTRPAESQAADRGDRGARAQVEVRKPSPEQEGIEKALRDYAEAFNKKDAKALAAHWAPEGVYINRETGERIAGREAILQDFTELLKEQAAKRLSINLNDVRLVKPDVAIADGRALLSVAGDGGPTETAFTSVFVKQDDQWLIDSVHETQSPTPSTPRAALADLEWMVGAWVDDSDEATVTTSVRWSPHEAFLIRSFRVQMQEDDELREGTQVIGWDPKNKQIRSWTFDSDGSFGEGTWSKNGDEWLVRMSHTLPDGRMASGTQVISRVDNDSVTVQSIGSEIEGEPAPTAEPVKVIRVRDQAAQN